MQNKHFPINMDIKGIIYPKSHYGVSNDIIVMKIIELHTIFVINHGDAVNSMLLFNFRTIVYAN